MGRRICLCVNLALDAESSGTKSRILNTDSLGLRWVKILLLEEGSSLLHLAKQLFLLSRATKRFSKTPAIVGLEEPFFTVRGV